MKKEIIISLCLLFILISLSVTMSLRNYEEPCVSRCEVIKEIMCCDMNKTICWTEGKIKIYFGEEREQIEDYECHPKYYNQCWFCSGELTGISLKEPEKEIMNETDYILFWYNEVEGRNIAK